MPQRYSRMSKDVKSKIPCLLGFFPVMKEVQAEAVTGGITDSRSAETPRCIAAERFGKHPCAASGRTISHVAPSRLTMKTFGVWWSNGILRTRKSPDPAAAGSLEGP